MSDEGPSACSCVMFRQLVMIVLAGLLMTAGCDDPPKNTTAATAEGLWNGSTNTNRTMTIAVLDDGTSYFFYSDQGNAATVAGVLQGVGSSSNGNYSASSVKDFRIGAAPLDATISGTYSARQAFNGTITYQPSGTVGFTSSYNTSYDTQPTIASFAGVYQGQAGSSGGSQPATITMQSDGTFTGTEQNSCAFTGKATLRAKGNVLDQTITFGGFPCFFGNATLQGIAFRDPTTNRLYSAAPNGTRTDAAIFFGTRIF